MNRYKHGPRIIINTHSAPSARARRNTGYGQPKRRPLGKSFYLLLLAALALLLALLR